MIVADPPGYSHLYNMNGKCLASPQSRSDRGTYLIQWDCLQETGQQWKYDNQHICNGYNQCVAAPQNSAGNVDVLQWDPLDENGQRYTITQFMQSGFNNVQNKWGKCLSVAENSGSNGARIVLWDCNQDEGGQRWRWLKM